MIRRLGAIAAAALLAAAPAPAAEGGPIRSGEHDAFSRLVLRIDPQTEWSLETSGGRAVLSFPGKAIDFGTGGIFDLIPRARIAEVTTRRHEGGTTVEVALACECRVSTVFVDGRYLALDVGDPTPAAAAAAHPETDAGVTETREDRAAREANAVASAEAILIQQIERAASQGIINLSAVPEGGADSPPAEAEVPGEATGASAQDAAPAPGALPDAGHPVGASAKAAPNPPPATEPGASPPPRPVATAPVALAAGAQNASGLAALLDGDQVRATTVFDRDRAAAAASRLAPPPPPECLPDSAFAVDGWSNRKPYRVQASGLSLRLLGEFDRPDPVILERRLQLDLRHGLGLEVEMMLAAFPGVVPGADLYLDLARAVEGRPLASAGPLSRTAACPGAHGLWQAIGGAVPAFRNAGHFAGVQAAFADLPPDLRALVGPTLILRLLDAGQAGAARLVYDTIARAPGDDSADRRLAEARLVAAEGNPDVALQALAALVDADASIAADALLALARIARQATLPLPDRLLTDLQGAAQVARGTAADAEFRLLVAAAHETRGEVAEALSQVREAVTAFPGDPRFPGLAADVLSGADPEARGAAAYARAVLDNFDLLPTGSAADAARETIARRLLDLGLAPAARAVIAPAAGRGAPGARRLAAEALLRGGDARGAITAIDGLDDAEALTLRAEAQAHDGDFAKAVTTLANGDRDAEAAAYAWPSGDWARVRSSDAPADRRGMATFMASRTGIAPTPSPSPDPAALDTPSAFAAPTPALTDPSLDAARRLLATGAKVETFVQDLLAPEASSQPVHISP